MTRAKIDAWQVEMVGVDTLKDHPRNYRGHPDDQIKHIVKSIQDNGFYRNVVIARDGTILAGHGVVKAARSMGFKSIPVHRLDLDPNEPGALKVLAADNEIGHLAEIDDRLLTEILKEIKDLDEDGLEGTGYDDMMLANLVMVTRPAGEINDFNAAAHWVGMPEYHEGAPPPITIVMRFRSMEDRDKFAEKLGLNFSEKTTSSWWPARPADDLLSLRFEEEGVKE